MFVFRELPPFYWTEVVSEVMKSTVQIQNLINNEPELSR